MGRLTQPRTLDPEPGAKSHTHPPLPQSGQSGHRGLGTAGRLKAEPVGPAHGCATGCRERAPSRPAGHGTAGSGTGAAADSRVVPRTTAAASEASPGVEATSLGTISGRRPGSPPRVQPGCRALRGGFAGRLCGVGWAEAPRPRQEGRGVWEAAGTVGAATRLGRRLPHCGAGPPGVGLSLAPPRARSALTASGTGWWHAARGSSVPRARVALSHRRSQGPPTPVSTCGGSGRGATQQDGPGRVGISEDSRQGPAAASHLASCPASRPESLCNRRVGSNRACPVSNGAQNQSLRATPVTP